MHDFAKWLAAGAIVSVGALWVGDAPAQSFAGSGNGVAAMGTDVAVNVQARPTAAEIVARMLDRNKERLAELEHYESERTYRVEYTGTGGEHHAQLEVHAVYTGPNQKQFTVVSESGSKFLCDKVLRKLVEGEQEATAKANRTQTTLGPENYEAELTGEETIATTGGAVRTWVLRVTPKVNNKFTYRGRVWVSEDDYAAVRIQGEPAKSPSWWINRASFESMYLRRGDVWLPAKNVSSSHVRIGGEARLTIEYGTYPVVALRALKPAYGSAENGARTVVLR
jgi:hypothetical protein